MENKKNGSAVKKIKINKKAVRPIGRKCKSETAVQKSSSAQKKLSKPVGAMAIEPVTNSVTDAFEKRVVSVL